MIVLTNINQILDVALCHKAYSNNDLELTEGCIIANAFRKSETFMFLREDSPFIFII